MRLIRDQPPIVFAVVGKLHPVTPVAVGVIVVAPKAVVAPAGAPPTLSVTGAEKP